MVFAVQNGFSEYAHDFMMCGIAGFNERVRYGIGVEDGKAHLTQHGADGAFAAGDAASDPKTEHERFYLAVTLDCGCFAADSPQRRRAAFTVLLMSMVMVMGPTPPGTGVSAPAVFAASGCTSPTRAEPFARNFSRRAGKFRRRDSASFALVTLFVPT